MPTVAIEGQFRFVVNTRQNAFEPAHVHVWVGNQDLCRVELNSETFMDQPPPGDYPVFCKPTDGMLRQSGRRGTRSTEDRGAGMGAVLVKNADRMMTSAKPMQEGIQLVFADGRRGLIPFADIPEIGRLSNVARIELPNPFMVLLRNAQGETVELPWDFARHYCDESYRPRAEAIAEAGRRSIGSRIRQLREAGCMTQDVLATAARIGRVTLVRIEKGEQSPRYDTLVALAGALGRPIAELLTP